MHLLAEAYTGLSSFQVLALIVVAILLVIALAMTARSVHRGAVEAADAASADDTSRYEPARPIANPDRHSR